mmetsp:Transcript_32028/g.76401  ORF Transcript_32028/g.76401 Transcript_32028/m.76401 type:complete len:245 (-) Transcript_32028:893-1627(-)
MDSPAQAGAYTRTGTSIGSKIPIAHSLSGACARGSAKASTLWRFSSTRLPGITSGTSITPTRAGVLIMGPRKRRCTWRSRRSQSLTHSFTMRRAHRWMAEILAGSMRALSLSKSFTTTATCACGMSTTIALCSTIIIMALAHVGGKFGSMGNHVRPERSLEICTSTGMRTHIDQKAWSDTATGSKLAITRCRCTCPQRQDCIAAIASPGGTVLAGSSKPRRSRSNMTWFTTTCSTRRITENTVS